MKLFLFALMLVSVDTFADWSPPPNPDPHAILQSAEDVSMRSSSSIPLWPSDVSDQEKADATAQFVWFYDNADAIDTSLGAVRQSFALSAWQKLGEVYPPALTQLTAARDARVDRVHEASNTANAFIDVASINGYLHDDQNTVDLFLWLDQTDTRVAQRVYSVAQPALVRTHQYALCGKYLDASHALQSAARTFEMMKKTPDPHPIIGGILGLPNASDFADNNFSNQAATIVALLAVNGEMAKAQEISKRAVLTYDSPQFDQALQQALNGVVPEPWPPH